MKLIRNIFVALATLLFSASLANAGEKWDMALAYGAGNFHSANATEFAKNVTEKSGGKLTIVTHPGGSLFKGGEIFRAVRTGQAPIGERFMSALGKEDPLLEVDSQPFLATNYGAAMRLYKASKPEIVKGLDSKGLVFLYAVPWPAQGLYSKKEINSVWENGVGYFYDIAAWFPKNMVIVNKDAWNKLDGATQKLLKSEAAKAEKKGWALSKKGNKDDKKALADAGMKVGKVNSALKKHFEGVGATMSKEWADRAGSRGQAVLAAY